MSDLRYPNVYPPFDHVRVSRENQNVENQIRILLEEGLSRDLIYVDPVSGISTMQNREGCSLMIQFIRAHPGKPIMLYFFEISRMGRSFLNTLNMLLSLGESGTGAGRYLEPNPGAELKIKNYGILCSRSSRGLLTMNGKI